LSSGEYNPGTNAGLGSLEGSVGKSWHLKYANITIRNPLGVLGLSRLLVIPLLVEFPVVAAAYVRNKDRQQLSDYSQTLMMLATDIVGKLRN